MTLGKVKLPNKAFLILIENFVVWGLASKLALK